MLKIYTPFEKGKMAHMAGCTIHDAPEELSEKAVEEWKMGWKQADVVVELHKNDLDKFNHNEMGDI